MGAGARHPLRSAGNAAVFRFGSEGLVFSDSALRAVVLARVARRLEPHGTWLRRTIGCGFSGDAVTVDRAKRSQCARAGARTGAIATRASGDRLSLPLGHSRRLRKVGHVESHLA